MKQTEDSTKEGKIPEEGGVLKKNVTKKRIAAVAIALFIAVAAFLVGWFGRYLAIDSRMRDLMWAFETMEKNFYGDLDTDKIYDDLFSALTPDPYSRYYTKAEYEEILRESEGENSGYGLSVTASESGVRVFSVVGNSPAEIAGLKKGMYLLEYGKSENGMKKVGTLDETLAFLRAETGTVYLKFGYHTDGTGATVAPLARAEYHAGYCSYMDSGAGFSVRGEGVLGENENRLVGANEKTAYIRIDEFNGNVAQELVLCLNKMTERGRTDLILDLRSNGGGYMDKLTSVASHLMKNASGKTVVATAQYKSGKIMRYSTSKTDYGVYFHADSRILLLADENTASASECLIGAMVDYGTVGYGDIILRKNDAGEARTYGKGIMQSHFRDLKGNVMKLTVATVHWPVSNTCIHGVGVRSDDAAVSAPLLWGEDDPQLAAAVARLSN